MKLDRTFGEGMSEVRAQSNLAEIIRLSHVHGASVLATGVETEAQQDILVRMGCDQLQGYLFAKPMPADKLFAWAKGDDLPANKAYFKQAHFNGDDSRDGDVAS